jgi:hypothetical protein
MSKIKRSKAIISKSKNAERQNVETKYIEGKNHPQNEEKRVQCITIQWFSGASRKKILVQHRINTLYDRYSNNLINSSELLTGLAFVVTKKIK